MLCDRCRYLAIKTKDKQKISSSNTKLQEPLNKLDSSNRILSNKDKSFIDTEKLLLKLNNQKKLITILSLVGRNEDHIHHINIYKALKNLHINEYMENQVKSTYNNRSNSFSFSTGKLDIIY